MLSQRSSAIAATLVTSATPTPVRELAQRYSVSERTIKYDVRAIRRWLAPYDAEVRALAGQGLTIAATDAQRARLLQELNGLQVPSSRRDRARLISLQLAVARRPLPIRCFTESFGVSRSTVVSDLHAVEATLHTFGLPLLRTRTGLSAGQDNARRQRAADTLVGDELTDTDVAWIASYLSGASASDAPPVSPGLAILLEAGLFDDSVARCATSIAQDLAGAGIQLGDAAISRLFVRLLIATEVPTDIPARDVRAGSLLDMVSPHLAALADAGHPLAASDFDFVFAETALAAFGQQFGSGTGWEPPHVRPLVRRLVQLVGEELGLDLSGDSILVSGLQQHLVDRLNKINLQIAEPRGAMEELLAEYADVYRAVRRCVPELLGAAVQLTEADLAYLAIHFASAVERSTIQRRYRALVVCATGRGTAQLIRTVVQSRIPAIDVVATCSTFDAPKVAADDSIDLVISTFPLPIDKPVAVIRSIPTERDLAEITACLNSADPARSGPRQLRSHPSTRQPGLGSIAAAGLALATALMAAADPEWDPERTQGFQLHCILLEERIRTGQQYAAAPELSEPLRAGTPAVRDVERVLRRHHPDITAAELAAVLTYFTTEGTS